MGRGEGYENSVLISGRRCDIFLFSLLSFSKPLAVMGRDIYNKPKSFL